MSGYCSGHSTASVSAAFTSARSPTSSNVRPPSSTRGPSSALGRTTSRAASRSACASSGSATSRWRAAARSPASRTRAMRSAATKPGVRAAISSSTTSSASGTALVTTSSCRRRWGRSGSGTASSWSSSPGARRAGSTCSGRDVVHTTAIRPDSTAVCSSVVNVVPSGPGRSRGTSASTSSRSTTVGEPAGARRLRSERAASSGCSAASCGPQARTSRAPTCAATASTSAALPEPAGPVSSTPMRALVPSRASRSGWWNPSSSHSRRAAACDSRPGRSATFGAAAAPAADTIGVALPVVLVPPCHPTTVHRHQHRPGRVHLQGAQQRGAGAVTEPGAQPLPGLPVVGRGGRQQQRHVVPGGDELPEQGRAQQRGVHRGDHLGPPGEHDGGRGPVEGAPDPHR